MKHLAGFCTRITVVINKDGSLMVEDNGRGIPVDPMEKNGKSALEVVLTVLHAGGKFDKETYQVSGGLHGVGVSVVNALSNWLSAQVYRDGNIYEMRFSKGKPPRPSHRGKRRSRNFLHGTSSGTVSRHRLAEHHRHWHPLLRRYPWWNSRHASRPSYRPARSHGATHYPTGNEQEDRASLLATLGNKLTGTRIHFVPDATIFETTTFDYDVLAHRLRELAFLNAGLTIIITDERTGDTATYCYAGGLSEFVKYLNEGAEVLHPTPIYITKKDAENKLELEVAMQYTTGYDEKLYSYVNSVNTREGGTHLEGFRSAITRAINASRSGTASSRRMPNHPPGRGCPRRPNLRRLRQDGKPPVRGPDQDAPREQQRQGYRRLARLRGTHRILR